MEDITALVKMIATFWILLMMLIGIISVATHSDLKYEKSSRYLIMISLSFFLPSLNYLITKDGRELGAYTFGYPLLNLFGLFLIFFGLTIHIVSMFTLRKQWSPNIQFNENHALIKNGIYKYIRHPIYLSILIELLGFCVALSNWLSFLIILLPNLLCFSYRIYAEEKALVSIFGDSYLNYIKTTKRLIPKII